MLNVWKRIAVLQQKISLQNLDCAIITQNRALFYYSATAQNAHLVVPAQGQPLLLVKKNFRRAAEETGLSNIKELTSIKQLPALVGEHMGYAPSNIGLEMDVVPAKAYQYYQKMFKGASFEDVSGIIRQQRAIKSPEEVATIRRAGQLQVDIFRQIPDIIQEGMREIDLAAELEYRARKKGHFGLTPLRGFNLEIHYGHIMSGESGAVPSSFEGPTGGQGLGAMMPQGAGWGLIEAHQPIIVDYMGCYEGYIVDMTRIFAIGVLPKHLVKAHQVAVDIQDMIAQSARPGVSCDKLYRQAVDYAAKAGLAKYFLGYQYTLPFVGHGVGLEVNELPVIAKGFDQPLAENSVVALEPKFVFPGEGAVGIENTFLVTPDGMEKMTDLDDAIITI